MKHSWSRDALRQYGLKKLVRKCVQVWLSLYIALVAVSIVPGVVGGKIQPLNGIAMWLMLAGLLAVLWILFYRRPEEDPLGNSRDVLMVVCGGHLLYLSALMVLMTRAVALSADVSWLIIAMSLVEDVALRYYSWDWCRGALNLRWFLRTWPYMLLGGIMAYWLWRNDSRISDFPQSRNVLWWIVCGVFSLVIFTYGKQIFDERICPKEGPYTGKDSAYPYGGGACAC